LNNINYFKKLHVPWCAFDAMSRPTAIDRMYVARK